MKLRNQTIALVLLVAGGVLQTTRAEKSATIPDFMSAAEAREWQTRRVETAVTLEFVNLVQCNLES
jgi:hypothetical protein